MSDICRFHQADRMNLLHPKAFQFLRNVLVICLLAQTYIRRSTLTSNYGATFVSFAYRNNENRGSQPSLFPTNTSTSEVTQIGQKPTCKNMFYSIRNLFAWQLPAKQCLLFLELCCFCEDARKQMKTSENKNVSFFPGSRVHRALT